VGREGFIDLFGPRRSGGSARASSYAPESGLVSTRGAFEQLVPWTSGVDEEERFSGKLVGPGCLNRLAARPRAVNLAATAGREKGAPLGLGPPVRVRARDARRGSYWASVTSSPDRSPTASRFAYQEKNPASGNVRGGYGSLARVSKPRGSALSDFDEGEKPSPRKKSGPDADERKKPVSFSVRAFGEVEGMDLCRGGMIG